MYIELFSLAVFAFLYSVCVGRIERTILSGPIIFVGFGIAMGPLGVGLFEGDVHLHILRFLADMTLVFVLFSDAANVEDRVLRKRANIPARMLLMGLPGAILLGGLAAFVMFDVLSIFEAFIVGTMLAATDAALGKAVVTDPRLPNWLRVGLNVESGLNDGLCVPLLLIFIAVSLEATGAAGAHEGPLLIVLEELGIGLVVGIGLTFLASHAVLFGRARGWITQVWHQMTVPTVALACFALASELHGSGYIAAFVGGLTFRHIVGSERGEPYVLAAEGLGEVLAMLTWIMFGATVVAGVLELLSWEIVMYTALSLTVVRMLPMVLCLTGTGTSMPARIYAGWFGPRGLASLVFVVIVLDSGVENGPTIALIAMVTVFSSLVLHGLSAQPLTAWLVSRSGSENTDGA